MTSITLHEGDNRDSLRRLIDQGVRVHSVCTDPPYGLVSITKRFSADNAAPAKSNGATGVFGRASAGFMGSKWDGTGIERDPEFWGLIYDILLPGGYVLAFSSPRTGHWQACAMELAGFVMHPFFGWVYGQGFPKAHNAAMAIDKTLGVEQGFVAEGDPVKRMIPGADQHKDGWEKTGDREYQPGKRVPGSPEAAQWDGWAYGAQSMKPALEPIYVGQKPFSEKNGALNLLKHGVGAVNIDGCRVQTTDNLNGGAYAKVGGRTESQSMHAGSGMNVAGKTVGTDFVQPTGRHPANLLHDGSEDVVAMFPVTSSGTGAVKRKSASENNGNTGAAYGAESRPEGAEMISYGDSGSAARFFNSFPLDADPLFYHGKATKADRAGSKHPTVKPIQLMRWLCRLVTPAGGTVLDPFGGSGTTGAAAQAEGFDCILMEAEEQFIADIRSRFGLPAPVAAFDDFDSLLVDDFDSL